MGINEITTDLVLVRSNSSIFGKKILEFRADWGVVYIWLSCTDDEVRRREVRRAFGDGGPKGVDNGGDVHKIRAQKHEIFDFRF